jgi:hypothetical protein
MIFEGVEVPKDVPIKQNCKDPTNDSKNQVISKFEGPVEQTCPAKSSWLRFWLRVKDFWPKN